MIRDRVTTITSKGRIGKSIVHKAMTVVVVVKLADTRLGHLTSLVDGTTIEIMGDGTTATVMIGAHTDHGPEIATPVTTETTEHGVAMQEATLHTLPPPHHNRTTKLVTILKID